MGIEKRAVKVWVSFLLVLCCLGLAVSVVPVKAEEWEPESLGPKKRVAVLDVDVTFSRAPRGLAETVQVVMINALVDSGRYIVLERRAMADIFEEQRLGLTGAITPETAVQVGELLGAQVLVKTVVTEFSEERTASGRVGPVVIQATTGRITMDVRLIDAATGVILHSKTVSADKTVVGGGLVVRDGAIGIDSLSGTPMGEAVQEAVEQAVSFVTAETEAVPWQGQVVLADADGTYVNAGRDLGLLEGDHLKVYRRGQELVDPATGLSLGFQMTGIGLVRINRVEDSFSIASLVSGLPGSRNDIVEYVTSRQARQLTWDFPEPGDLHAREDLSSVAALSTVMQDKTIVVIIPEHHLRRTIRRTIPDPAAETEIIRLLVENGFAVVDQLQVADMRYDGATMRAIDDVRAAISLARRFDADMVIIGEAFSEWAADLQGLVSCRARVEARIIDMESGRIVAADAREASALNISENLAGKAALQEAGGLLAEYFVEQLYAYGQTEALADDTSSDLFTTEIEIFGLQNYGQLLEFEHAAAALRDVDSLERQYFAGGTAVIVVESWIPPASLTDLIYTMQLTSMDLDIVGFSGSRVELEVLP